MNQFLLGHALTPSPLWCHLKTIVKSAKFENPLVFSSSFSHWHVKGFSSKTARFGDATDVFFFTLACKRIFLKNCQIWWRHWCLLFHTGMWKDFHQKLPDLVTSLMTEGALFISMQLSTDVASALRKVWVQIRLWKQPSTQAATWTWDTSTLVKKKREEVPSWFKCLWFYLCWCKLCQRLWWHALFYLSCS